VSGIVSAFKTTTSTTIKERINGVGFKKFEESAQYQKVTGLKEEFLDKFLDHLAERFVVPENNRKDLKNVLEEIQWADSNEWQCFNIVFSTGAGGQVKTAALMANHDDKNAKYNFVFTDITASFELGDDLLIINKSKSILGGIYSDSSDKIVHVPRNLTPEDIKTVMSFFQLVTMKNIADNLGIKVADPLQ